MKFTYASGDRPLEGYTIKRGVGRGGFGEVYQAMSDGGKEVALKFVQKNLEVELRGVGHCLNLKHPNLVSLHDLKQGTSGDYWVVMEFVAGETLDDVIAHNANGLTPEEALAWLKGICDGVAHLHAQGLVHRDLKPGNVFREESIVKVGDYGLSKFISTSRRSGQTGSVGTVHYMAPEIAHGRYGKEVDLYAIGIMLYEMLTGRVPFDGTSPGEILMKHMTATPDLAPLPPAFRPVVARLLNKDPHQRYSSVQAMMADLTGYLAAPPDAPPETVQPSLVGGEGKLVYTHETQPGPHLASDDDTPKLPVVISFATLFFVSAGLGVLGGVISHTHPDPGLHGDMKVAVNAGFGGVGVIYGILATLLVRRIDWASVFGKRATYVPVLWLLGAGMAWTYGLAVLTYVIDLLTSETNRYLGLIGLAICLMVYAGSVLWVVFGRERRESPRSRKAVDAGLADTPQMPAMTPARAESAQKAELARSGSASGDLASTSTDFTRLFAATATSLIYWALMGMCVAAGAGLFMYAARTQTSDKNLSNLTGSLGVAVLYFAGVLALPLLVGVIQLWVYFRRNTAQRRKASVSTSAATLVHRPMWVVKLGFVSGATFAVMGILLLFESLRRPPPEAVPLILVGTVLIIFGGLIAFVSFRLWMTSSGRRGQAIHPDHGETTSDPDSVSPGDDLARTGPWQPPTDEVS